ncbi:hypothetical protein [Modestobacter sp. SYSU DS0875]
MTPRSEAPHPAARRATAAVVVGVVAWLVFLLLTVSAQAYSWAWVLSLAVIGAAWVGARVLVRDIAERRASEVDEYELAQRNTARSAGYVAALLAALVLYLVLSVAGELAERGHDQLLLQAHQLVLAAFLPAAAGPTFLVAWRLRDQPDPGE